MTLSVFAAAREAPETLAVVTNEEALTYRALSERATLAALWLEAHGALEPDAGPVAVIATLELATLEMLYALVTFGVPILLVHARLTTSERAALFARCRPVLVVDSSWRRSAPRKLTRLPEPSPNPEATLCIVPSSGTSGEPKLVVLSRRAFVASARASARNLDWLPDDRWLLCLPLAHVGGLSIVMRCWLARSTVVVAKDASAEAVTQAIKRYRPSLASLVPTLLSRLSANFTPPPELRAVLLGGAPPTASLVADYRKRGFPLLTTYGLSETCSQVCTQAYADRFSVPRVERAITSSGRPLPGMRVRVREDRIEVKSPSLLSSYLGVSSPPLLDDGWFATGDRGFIDEQGELFVTGRSSELIITGGENVDPLEVEALLLQLPAIAAACVFGIDDSRFGQAVAAALVVAPGQSIPGFAIERTLQASIASHKRPRYVAFVEDLPLTPAGKVDRRAVARLVTPKLVAI